MLHASRGIKRTALNDILGVSVSKIAYSPTQAPTELSQAGGELKTN